jgi:hypothetical protein
MTTIPHGMRIRCLGNSRKHVQHSKWVRRSIGKTAMQDYDKLLRNKRRM